MQFKGNRTYLSIALLVVITLAKQFNIAVDQLDPEVVTAIQTLLVGAVAWFLRAGVNKK